MKLSTIYKVVFFVFLLLDNVIASPPQRLIIQFDQPLNAVQKQQFSGQLNLILKNDYSVIAHSSDDRWIVVIKPSSQVIISHAIDEIKRLDTVQYVEPDQVLKAFH